MEEAVILGKDGKDIRAYTCKRDNSGIGIIILEENLVQISFIIAKILLFMKCNLGLHFQCPLMLCFFVTQPQQHNFGESLVKIDCIIAKI